MLAYILSPAVGATAKRLRWRRLPAVLLIYLLILGPLVLLIWLVEPSIARETRDFVGSAGDIVRASLVQLFGGERLQSRGTGNFECDTVIASATGWVGGYWALRQRRSMSVPWWWKGYCTASSPWC